jgi:Matrixin
MTLPQHLRGFRALMTMLCVSLALPLALAPPASAKPRHRHAKRPTATRTVIKPAPAATGGLGDRLGLGADTQLAAMRTAIAAAPLYFAALPNGCLSVTPLLTSAPGPTIAGNFRDAASGCYVWLNLSQSSMLTGSEICKVALHEMGHLSGLQHSADPSSVMFAPFRSDPLPAPCRSPSP